MTDWEASWSRVIRGGALGDGGGFGALGYRNQTRQVGRWGVGRGWVSEIPSTERVAQTLRHPLQQL